MTCREFKVEMHGSRKSDWSPELLRHLESCPACAAKSRAALLLRLGSGGDEGAVPRAGFEERLRARLAYGPAPSRGHAWNGGFELLVRPALAVAATLTLLCAGLYVQTTPERAGDLASLVENDTVFASLLTGDPWEILDASQGAPAATEEP